jgi:hypothetical protein
VELAWRPVDCPHPATTVQKRLEPKAVQPRALRPDGPERWAAHAVRSVLGLRGAPREQVPQVEADERVVR